jgi:hypothetical protein
VIGEAHRRRGRAERDPVTGSWLANGSASLIVSVMLVVAAAARTCASTTAASCRVTQSTMLVSVTVIGWVAGTSHENCVPARSCSLHWSPWKSPARTCAESGW